MRRQMKRNLLVFATVLALGVFLGTLGTVSFPIGTNMSYFWPAAVIQSVAGILFGIWGVLAATIFPSISNAFTDGSTAHVIGLLPANFIQSALPLYFLRKLRISPYLKTKRDIAAYAVLCAAAPHVIGGIAGCTTLYALGEMQNSAEYFTTLRVWLVGNIPCAVLFGILLLKSLTPALRDSNLLLCAKTNESE